MKESKEKSTIYLQINTPYSRIIFKSRGETNDSYFEDGANMTNNINTMKRICICSL